MSLYVGNYRYVIERDSWLQNWNVEEA